MTTTIFRALLLYIFLVFPVFLSGQIPGDKFTSGEYRFSIDLPAKPTERRSVNSEILKFSVFGEYLGWTEMPGGAFASIESYSISGDNAKLTPMERTRIMAEYARTIVDGSKKGGLMTQESPFELGELKGTEVRGIIRTGKLLVRMFFIKDRLFILSLSKVSAPDFTWHREVLDSFHVLTKDEYIAALIIENMPETLPQAPHPTRPANDLAEEGLKGKISSVIEDEQESLKSPRQRSGEYYYDPEGNLVKQVGYVSGYPDDIMLWGWIDGMRASNFAVIYYPVGEGPNDGSIVSMMEVPARISAEKKRDPRYDNRYEFKYDAQNRMVERKQFKNDGDLDSTEKFIYSPKTLTIDYDDGGDKTRRVETLDANGSVIEEKSYGPNGKLKSWYLYKYEVDAKGNWIARRASEKRTVKGKSVLKPGPTRFRTITYYE